MTLLGEFMIKQKWLEHIQGQVTVYQLQDQFPGVCSTTKPN